MEKNELPLRGWGPGHNKEWDALCHAACITKAHPKKLVGFFAHFEFGIKQKRPVIALLQLTRSPPQQENMHFPLICVIPQSWTDDVTENTWLRGLHADKAYLFVWGTSCCYILCKRNILNTFIIQNGRSCCQEKCWHKQKPWSICWKNTCKFHAKKKKKKNHESWKVANC